MWSEAQWLLRSPIVLETATQWAQNCCKMCQDDWPYYKDPKEVEPRATPAKQDVPQAKQSRVWLQVHAVTPIVSAVTLWSLQSVQERQIECREWLQENIPWQCWQRFMAYLQDRNCVYRKEMEQINTAQDYGVGKTLRKWMSYDGAVLAWHSKCSHNLRSVLCLFALCEWPLHAVAFAEVITNVACTRGRGVLSGRLSLGLPQLQQKPAEHHSHADEIQELWGVWRRG